MPVVAREFVEAELDYSPEQNEKRTIPLLGDVEPMLDRVVRPSKRRTPFEQWWDGLPSEIRENQDVAFARRCFRTGHVIGARPGKTKFRFRAGKLQVSVWAANAKDAAKQAAVELDFRFAKADKKRPQGGWRLTPIRDDA